MNYNPLDDEEERKRREAAAAAASDEAVMGGGAAPANPSFFDTAGQVISNRFNQAMDRVSGVGDAIMNPQQALQQRFLNDQRRQEEEQAANTEVKTQTVKTYGDGSQEQVVKTQIPAQQAQQAGAGERLTTPIPNMPANLPAQGSISPEQAAQQAQMAQLPQPGPQVQVAGQTQMPPQAGAPGASLAQAGAQAQAQPRPQIQAQAQAQAQDQENGISQQPPAWLQAANDAGIDRDKLFDVATRFPESRAMIMTKLEASIKNKNKEEEAMATLQAAQAGDLKAMNKIQQAIKPETGKAKEEVTVNDYLKAVLYKRLGLDALAADVQNKIIGKDTKFGQMTLGGANWETETDSSGRIIRAQDKDGNIATESTLNQLRAGAQKFGTHASQFTGGIHTVPNAEGNGQDLVMPVQNTIDPTKSGFIYMSGPKQGQMYSGTTTPTPQSVSTDFSKNVNRAFIEFNTKPTIAAATKALETASLLSAKDYNDTLAAIRGRSPEIFNQIVSGQAGTPPVPVNAGAQGANAGATNVQGGTTGTAGAVPPPKPAAQPPVSGPATPNTAVGGAGGTGLLGKTEGIKQSTQTQGEVDRARLKPPAEERGKQEVRTIQQQGFADSTYPLVSHNSRFSLKLNKCSIDILAKVCADTLWCWCCCASIRLTLFRSRHINETSFCRINSILNRHNQVLSITFSIWNRVDTTSVLTCVCAKLLSTCSQLI